MIREIHMQRLSLCLVYTFKIKRIFSQSEGLYGHDRIPLRRDTAVKRACTHLAQGRVTVSGYHSNLPFFNICS